MAGVAFAALAVWATVVQVKRFLRSTEEVTVREECRCGSRRTRYRVTVDGVQTQATVEVEPSPVFIDLLAGRHAHEWQLGWSNTERRRGLSGTLSHGDGVGARPNGFTSLYSRAGFRSFVLGKIEARELTRERAARYALVADDAPDGAFPEGGEGPFDEFEGARWR